MQTSIGLAYTYTYSALASPLVSQGMMTVVPTPCCVSLPVKADPRLDVPRGRGEGSCEYRISTDASPVS
ncbi:hypothetical protein KQX54_021202 [Cotesia glomerata]|uniref:Uncharacterized protein n=1 Tax=Cotesia glomerata TaxID=32391 RepID=A0AAV7IUN6_COTGL|nr:hypothetical protein KQX54_021202 [Cotesia glomerata]